jgi:hypothetical protein
MPEGAPDRSAERIEVHQLESLIQALHRTQNELRDAATRIVNSGQMMAQLTDSSQAELARIAEQQSRAPEVLNEAIKMLSIAATRLTTAADALGKVPDQLDKINEICERASKSDASRHNKLESRLTEIERTVRHGIATPTVRYVGGAKHWPYLLILFGVIVWAVVYRGGARSSEVAGPVTPVCQPGTLQAKGRQTGSIAEGDCRVRDFIKGADEGRADGYYVNPPTDGMLSIVMSSSAFDPYLLVFDSQSGTQLCADDDGAGGRNARCSIKVGAKRSYLLVAKALSTGTGNYVLDLGLSETSTTTAPAPAPAPAPEETSKPSAARTCAVEILPLDGSIHEGSLSPEDCRIRELRSGSDADESYADRYTLAVPERATVEIEMASKEFETFLTLVDARQGQVATSADRVEGRVRLRWTVPPGTYTVFANSSSHKPATGEYTINARIVPQPAQSATTVAQAPTNETPARGAANCLINVLPLNGIPRQGDLSQADCRVRDILRSVSDNSFVDQYRIVLPQRAVVEINLRSVQFDSYLSLYDQTYHKLDSNDDGGGGVNARIRRLLPAGEYVVFANSSGTSSQTGTYTVVATLTP